MDHTPQVIGFAYMVAVAAAVTAVIGWQILAGFVMGGLTVMVAAAIACNVDFD